MPATDDKVEEKAPVEAAEGDAAANDAAPPTDEEQAPAAEETTADESAGTWVLKLAGVAVFIAASWVLGHAMRSRIEPDPVETPQESGETSPHAHIDPGLNAQELVKLGKTALDDGRFRRSERLLEEARTRIDPNDTIQKIELYKLLAEANDGLGRRRSVSEIHRTFAQSLSEKLGPAIPLFNEGRKKLAEGDLAGAYRLFSQFLLRTDDIDDAARHYVSRARELRTDILARQFWETAPATVKLQSEPESYFDR